MSELIDGRGLVVWFGLVRSPADSNQTTTTQQQFEPSHATFDFEL